MTRTEFEILQRADIRETINKNIDIDPLKLALKLGSADGATISTQVKYLQRCRAKLPSYYARRCIVPPLSYEQCSGELAAASKEYSGNLAIDLTCGLGVDTLNFARRFEKVITIERDSILADVARYNFALLAAENIDVKNNSAENFLENYIGEKADLIFIDPARRGDENKRVFLLEDCSPNVVELCPKMLKHAKRVLIKLSPLFDIEQALKIFSGKVSKIEIVSLTNECKEMLVELKDSCDTPEIVIKTSFGSYDFTPQDIGLKAQKIEIDIEKCNYLLIPDAALYKGRLTVAFTTKYLSENVMKIQSENGFCFSEMLPENFCGRVFTITKVTEYQPKKVKKELKERGISRINIIRRTFPYSVEQIKKSLSVAEGGSISIAFSEINGQAYMFFLQK